MSTALLPTHLHTADLALIVVYLIGITLFGLRFRARNKDAGSRSLRSYFLADQTVPWWAIALSIVSAETSTLTIISIPGVAYAGDLGFLQVVIGYMLGRIVVALIFLPKYFQGRMLTAYQLIDQRFGHTLHKVTAGLFLLTRAAAEGVRVFAVSIVVGIAIGTRDTLSIAIITVLTLLYTFEGGLTAVIWTDVVQMGIYILGTIVAMVTLGNHVPGGWVHIHAVASAAGKFHLFNFALNFTQSYTFWAGVLGGTFLTMASHGTDQLMVQRMLAARNLRESRIALLSSGVVIFFQFTLFLLIGIGLYVFYKSHPMTFVSADRIFPIFIVREMPIGIAGLLVAAILAAAMSNLSAALNSLSSTTVVDFYMHWKPEANDRERMIVSRSSTVMWALVLFAVAVYSVHAGGKGHVVEIGLSIASVAYGALLGVFLLGTLTRRATQAGAIVGMIFGFALNMALWLQSGPIHINNLPLLGNVTIPQVAFTWYVLIGAIATFVIGYIVSLLFTAKASHRKIVGAMLLCIVFAANVANAQPVQPDFTAVSSLLNQAIAAKKLPGAVVLINHNGATVFERAYGDRALEPVAEPMTEDTVFDMASLTKCLVTATAVMQLYEANKLDFDDPVARYLPDFAQNGKQNVTIRELLTHYSGLPPDVDLKNAWGLVAPDKAEGVRRSMAASLATTPGTHFEYSDINFIVLGILVEKLSGQPLDVYAQENIFMPLGMAHTRYLPIGAASWKAADWVPRTAPTEYDNEGDASSNPDFGHMLRGVVHDPTTRRMGGVAGQAGVFSTAHDISLYAQALLDKLLHNTGPFPLKQSSLQLMVKPEQPATAQTGATIFTSDGQVTKGVAIHGFGWDINTAYSRPRGSVFPIGSFGHTGFTGTSLWMDPSSNTFVILLANSIHPRGALSISPLRGLVATAAARALGEATQTSALKTSTLKTQTGIDVLEQTRFEALQQIAARHHNHLNIGLLTNQSGVDSQGRRTIDVLSVDAPKFVHGLSLKTLFSPEHGIAGTKDDTHVGNASDSATGLPILSLYGAKDEQRRPRAEDLKQLDAVVIDLQDAGVRFYTYETVVGYFLEAASKVSGSDGRPLEIIVLDRPNIIGGMQVQGPVSDPGSESYTDYMPLPIRHGLTLGELALYFNTERRLPVGSPNIQAPIKAQLTVVSMRNWQRAQYFDDTGLPWINPSPNLPSVTSAIFLPGVELVSSADVSVGRGTGTPFEQIGASYIDASQLAAYLTARKIPGVSFTPTAFAVREDANHYPGHGKTMPGVHLTLTDRKVLDAPELGIELISALHHLYPQFPLAKVSRLIVNVDTLRALTNNEDPRAIAATWTTDLRVFEHQREPYLLYR